MTGALDGMTRAEAVSALAWLVEAGCDVVVQDAPRRWLAAAPPRPEPAPLPAPPALTPPKAGVPRSNLQDMDGRDRGGEDNGPEAARSLAQVADTLPALAAAVLAWTGDPLGTSPALFADGACPPGGVVVLADMPRGDDLAAGRVAAGEAGQLLDRMLAAIGLSRDGAMIANLVFRCTPAGREPRPEELAAAAPFVARALELAQPRAVLALGGTAASALSGGATGFNRTRGKWLTTAPAYGPPRPILATCHPVTLLANPQQKRLAWADLLTFQKGPPA